MIYFTLILLTLSLTLRCVHSCYMLQVGMTDFHDVQRGRLLLWLLNRHICDDGLGGNKEGNGGSRLC